MGTRPNLWAISAAALLIGGIAPASAIRGAPPKLLELSVKATFLPKFLAYIAWPPTASSAASETIQLCVIGRDPFGTRLDEAVAGQRVDQHPIAVRRVETAQAATGCRLAFVGGSASQPAAAALKELQGMPVLTVTDSRLGPARGMVHFDLKDGRVRFHIDDASAASSNLSISSRLLSLALTVKPRERTK
jgi:hypothetical protein